jgi:hypothetical protein
MDYKPDPARIADAMILGRQFGKTSILIQVQEMNERLRAAYDLRCAQEQSAMNMAIEAIRKAKS